MEENVREKARSENVQNEIDSAQDEGWAESITNDFISKTSQNVTNRWWSDLAEQMRAQRAEMKRRAAEARAKRLLR